MGCYRCPVCGGRGFVDNQFYTSTNTVGETTGDSTAFVACRSCQGTGIVFDRIEYNPHVTSCSNVDDPTDVVH